MKLAEALTFIRKHFKKHVSSDTVGDTSAPEIFVEVLDAIESEIPFGDKKANEILGTFLWTGCRKFNR